MNITVIILVLLIFILIGVGVFLSLPGKPTPPTPKPGPPTPKPGPPTPKPGPPSSCDAGGFTHPEPAITTEADCKGTNLCWNSGQCYGNIDCGDVDDNRVLPAEITNDGKTGTGSKQMTPLSTLYKTFYIGGTAYCKLDTCDDTKSTIKDGYWCQPGTQDETLIMGCTFKPSPDDVTHTFPDDDANWYTHWSPPVNNESNGVCKFSACNNSILNGNICIKATCDGPTLPYPISMDGTIVTNSKNAVANTLYKPILISNKIKACQINGCGPNFVMHSTGNYCVPNDYGKSCTPSAPLVNTVYKTDYDTELKPTCIFDKCINGYTGPTCQTPPVCTPNQPNMGRCFTNGRLGVVDCNTDYKFWCTPFDKDRTPYNPFTSADIVDGIYLITNSFQMLYRGMLVAHDNNRDVSLESVDFHPTSQKDFQWSVTHTADGSSFFIQSVLSAGLGLLTAEGGSSDNVSLGGFYKPLSQWIIEPSNQSEASFRIRSAMPNYSGYLISGTDPNDSKAYIYWDPEVGRRSEWVFNLYYQ